MDVLCKQIRGSKVVAGFLAVKFYDDKIVWNELNSPLTLSAMIIKTPIRGYNLIKNHFFF